MTEIHACARLDLSTLARNFEDIHPPLTSAQAVVEAERCHHCYDAPCVEACPTGIDIPGFIGRIATGDLAGSARQILDSNILGGSCARVCPTEILCEGACVRIAQEERAVEIGRLQRHAVDWQMVRGQPYGRAESSGRRIAVVGAGPAGLACAHRLAMSGHEITIFERRAKPGGLNEYGIAAYKLVDDFAQAEVDFILDIGGIAIEYGCELGVNLSLDALRTEYDAVFLAIGQNGVRALDLAGEALPGVRNAVDFIAELRQATNKSDMAVGRRVVVIGGGNTAVDAAVQSKRLGAEDVTLVYRRGPETMSATRDEQEWAATNGVLIRHWASPVAIEAGVNNEIDVVFHKGAPGPDGQPRYDRGALRITADMVLKAVGQIFTQEGLAIECESGRIRVDAKGRTSLPRVYAGGDCVAGMDLTVAAVAMGRNAAMAINTEFKERAHG
ncbi:oxidoreductase [Neoasaia chiangmaiensis NBRC 101099]|uniref:Dihydropyrimidine dehydrogenase n=1 Tax=Neoasaia chiangmaiensis TaxID=320497 RepID=A0A1U9KMH6_9PROT|nr:NAD(P)-dependent oxidoreductase [Neoasaia chiangmaiensis]AQS86968.1 dihydropyrimidine dehydrogenase [Neoasaia chiangmaiensis]GBR37715.1 oxidoreductase [Neoasaia chiangmaiensis NBRC 101099]GEN15084.1 oxidoreductase [Neoasaia chiangmaiensis]